MKRRSDRPRFFSGWCRMFGFAPAVAAGALLLLLLLLGTAAEAPAQFLTFGKNKVQYTNFDWHVLESEHFRLYFYLEEEDLARIALEMAEEGYDRLRRLFVHEVPHPIPLIIYSSHQDFEQTNITPFMLPEGVAGLTEFGRGRVLIPFGGSLNDFRTTIHHELVHVFQLSLEERLFARRSRSSIPSFPLWWVEGLAVHFSESRDTEADMILRDMVITGRLPSIGDLWRYNGTFTLYKLGQSLMDWIGKTYGDDKIREVYEAAGNVATFDDALTLALGASVRELSDRWRYAMRKLYYPDVLEAEPITFDTQAITRGPVDLDPVPVPDSLKGWENTFLFLSPRSGYTDIYAASIEGAEKNLRTVVSGERGAQFESLHPFRARMDINAKGELLFVSQRAGEDVIYVYSLREGRVTENYRFDDLVGLRSPSWASDGRRFAFAGLSRAGESDLYLFDRDSGLLDRLTNDRYEESDPAWRPNSDVIVFSSDRGPGEGEYRNLFWIDAGDRQVRYLTRGLWNDVSPSWSPDGAILYFSSDRDGRFGIYRTDLEGRGGKVLGGLEALMDPRMAPDGRTLLFSCYQGGEFRVRKADVHAPPKNPPMLAGLDPRAYPAWKWRSPVGDFPIRKARYTSRLSLEVAQGGVALDPNFRSGEGIQAMLADMMGNHLLFIQLGNTSFSTEDFLRNFSAGASYVNLSHRLNYGVSAFHFVGDYLDENGFPYHDRRAGASAILIYPVSKFQRFELINGLAYAETDRVATGFRRKGLVAQHSAAWIRDTSLWLPTGPIDGHRMNFTLGLTMDIQRGRTESGLVLADYRRYLRLGTYSAYAVRLQGLFSSGPNPRTFFLGGSLNLRGYPRRAVQGERSLLLNQEIRFPLVQRWMLQVPLGALEFPMIQGAVFADAGAAWNEGWPPPWLGSFGAGLRMGLGGILVLRLDLARRTDFKTLGDRNHWDFFVGWNY
ncbi:MAG: BamA/TamA family outer membrane protein [Candidatus Eisenbacteria bacterium]|nr:BamA/TamA family outer membrane protein [Candidatus Eisenbacteria bacterium]